jgi:hypothetical protein
MRSIAATISEDEARKQPEGPMLHHKQIRAFPADMVSVAMIAGSACHQACSDSNRPLRATEQRSHAIKHMPEPHHRHSAFASVQAAVPVGIRRCREHETWEFLKMRCIAYTKIARTFTRGTPAYGVVCTVLRAALRSGSWRIGSSRTATPRRRRLERQSSHGARATGRL